MIGNRRHCGNPVLSDCSVTLAPRRENFVFPIYQHAEGRGLLHQLGSIFLPVSDLLHIFDPHDAVFLQERHRRRVRWLR